MGRCKSPSYKAVGSCIFPNDDTLSSRHPSRRSPHNQNFNLFHLLPLRPPRPARDSTVQRSNDMFQFPGPWFIDPSMEQLNISVRQQHRPLVDQCKDRAHLGTMMFSPPSELTSRLKVNPSFKNIRSRINVDPLSSSPYDLHMI
jgi:hypothetical protein